MGSSMGAAAYRPWLSFLQISKLGSQWGVTVYVDCYTALELRILATPLFLFEH